MEKTHSGNVAKYLATKMFSSPNHEGSGKQYRTVLVLLFQHHVLMEQRSSVFW